MQHDETRRFSTRSTLHALQEREGYVTEISKDEFTARLTDLTANAPFDDEQAIFPLDEISERDAENLRPGMIFRWVIGYEQSVTGTKKRVSQIVFRDVCGAYQEERL